LTKNVVSVSSEKTNGSCRFDAEPLIAYYWDEPGSDDVGAIIDHVEDGELKGTVNTVTCTEVRYVCGRDNPDSESIRHSYPGLV